MDSRINTWAQGYFVDQPQYSHWSDEAKAEANRREALLVRPGPTGNPICHAPTQDAAEWIAQRLNRAANLEALASRLHAAAATNDQLEWIACIDALYRAAGLPDSTPPIDLGKEKAAQKICEKLGVSSLLRAAPGCTVDDEAMATDVINLGNARPAQ